MPIWQQLAMTGAGAALGAINDIRQLNQQRKLQGLQIQGQKEMTDYNMRKQMEMWENTNYSAQVKQLQKAGLNPGLIYASAGQGGSTNIQQGSVGSANAPTGGGEIGMAMQLGLTAALQKAQIDNIKADTQNKLASNPNIPKEGVILDKTAENLEATKNAINAGITNTQAQTRLTNLRYDIEEFGLSWDKLTAEDRATAIKKQNDQIEQTIQNLKSQKKLTDIEANNKDLILKAQLAQTIMDTWLKGEQGKLATEQAKESIQRVSDIINDNMHQAEKGHTPDKDLGIKNGLDDDFPSGLLNWLNIFIPLGGGTIIPRGTKPPEVKGFKQ